MGNSFTESLTATEDIEKFEKKIPTVLEIEHDIPVVEEKQTTESYIKSCLESDSTSLDFTGFDFFLKIISRYGHEYLPRNH
jgi:hypothetical protein